MTDRDPNHLHPLLKPLCQQWLNRCHTENLHAIVTETWRDPAREDQLHAQGITRATSANCKHCFMLDDKPASKAFDFLILDINGDAIQDGTHPLYAKAGAIGKTFGMIWGGDFHTVPDYDHFEIS